MLNLWIGLSRRDPALPPLIADLGYTDFWIEKQFANSDHQLIKPELILTSEGAVNTLLFEWKSGPNTDVEQIGRYRRVTADDLQAVEIPASAARSHDVVYVGQAEEETRLRIGIEATECGFPLLLWSDDGLSLGLNAFHVEALTEGFTPVLRIDAGAVPTGYVPIGPESEDWEVAEVAIPVVIAGLHERKPRFSVQEVAAAACRETWGIIGGPERRLIETKVGAVLQQAARTEFHETFTYSAATRMITIARQPLDLAPGKRTQLLQSMIRQQANLVARLRQERRGGTGEQLEFDLGPLGEGASP